MYIPVRKQIQVSRLKVTLKRMTQISIHGASINIKSKITLFVKIADKRGKKSTKLYAIHKLGIGTY